MTVFNALVAARLRLADGLPGRQEKERGKRSQAKTKTP